MEYVIKICYGLKIIFQTEKKKKIKYRNDSS